MVVRRTQLAGGRWVPSGALGCRIVEAPNRYPISLHRTRRILFDRYPFSIYYRVTDDEIVVVAVAHQKRRPGYWASRR